MCEKVDYGEAYNLCSMRAYRIRDLLNKLVEMAGCSVTTEQDPTLMRPTDEPVIMGDNTKFVEKTGWKPKIRIEQTLTDTLNYWREKQGIPKKSTTTP